jgi:hypothetical protein
MVLWKNLNNVMARHGIPEPKFKGFMADSTQANWNDVRMIYDSGDTTIPMKDRERTCLFHWAQSLEKHTKADIHADFQHQHRQFCRQYKNAASASESETRYLAIRAWWLSSGATTEQGLSRLELWLAFWHFRYSQWGGFKQLVSLLFFMSLHMTLSTLWGFIDSSFLHLIFICVSAISRISPNRSLSRCPHVISPN